MQGLENMVGKQKRLCLSAWKGIHSEGWIMCCMPQAKFLGQWYFNLPQMPLRILNGPQDKEMRLPTNETIP